MTRKTNCTTTPTTTRNGGKFAILICRVVIIILYMNVNNSSGIADTHLGATLAQSPRIEDTFYFLEAFQISKRQGDEIEYVVSPTFLTEMYFIVALLLVLLCSLPPSRVPPQPRSF